MPLPLREYYPLERAAELLECTVDDLFHWAASRKIYLCVMLKDAIGHMDISDWRDEYKLAAKHIDLPIIDESNTKYEQLLFVSNTLLHEDASHTRLIDKCRDILGDNSFEKVEFIKSCYDFGEESMFWSVRIDDSSIEEYDIIRELSKPDKRYVRIKVNLSGLFVLVDCDFYENIMFRTLGDDFVLITPPGKEFSIDCDLVGDIKFNDMAFFILKSDFLKIKESSINGDDILREYQRYRREDSEQSDKKILSRVSTPAKTAIKALIANHHPEIKNNPAKVAEVLAAEARQAGLGDVTFDKNTVSNWLRES
ncbi:hypothetical protein OPA95_000125 [Salmonella enterica]|nr:hypothetical protein [Salmonella enterica]EKC9527706.1 hypothetical protein [Salmonella enterica]EKG5781471.1 hypothetical protein [Salmonella enterica]